MSKNEDVLLFEGEVIDVLWGWTYKVVIPSMDWFEVVAKPSWKMKKNNIKIIPWDMVEIELCEYDMTVWRITFRSTWAKKRPNRA